MGRGAAAYAKNGCNNSIAVLVVVRNPFEAD
jgi:hypothetical protein